MKLRAVKINLKKTPRSFMFLHSSQRTKNKAVNYNFMFEISNQ